MDDVFNLKRFVNAQNSVYSQVITELNAGKKQTHWMWFIFPQLKGLGRSQMSEFYGVSGIDEARAYLSHPVLGNRYNECLKILLDISTNNPVSIFGYTDSKKLHSSLTLFAVADVSNMNISAVLNKFFLGITDFSTEKNLGNCSS